ncbi:hypothetical protein [Cellulomonas palmilytica]|uniref:hypothetical protein n=1 Tax=Cellulomonas palmilytica TaxID=2608402 RepID=UPI001F4709E8|nr:hypothetical protein [Cellulomonas palmilytica]UJP40845.1 hypothetical protein F1D97_05010 [Cellulomonas palmilytica]
MRSSQWKPSAGTVLWGVVILIFGVVIYLAGQQQNLRSIVLDGYDTSAGVPTMVLGAIIGLIGLVTLLIGVWQAVTNIDLASMMAARVLFDQEQADKAAEAASAETPAETPADADSSADATDEQPADAEV